MRMSTLFSRTRRKTESDDGSTAELLVRAGFVRRLAAGVYSLLPPAFNVTRRIEKIIRDEMNAIGGQEILMPVIHPADIWKESRRWYEIGAELGRFTDRGDRDMVLAMTHEEVVADLVRNEIHSYRQLPAMIYHIQTKWRDDPRPRAGLIRVREFTMADSYSLDTGMDGLELQYVAHYEAYKRIFAACEIPFSIVESDTGAMGGHVAHEYMYPTEIGEDTIITCKTCGYTANQQIAVFRSPASAESFPNAGAAGELERIRTPECRTITELASFLHIPERTCAKAVFMEAEFESTDTEPADDTVPETKTVVVMLPGDREVNEAKLAKLITPAGGIARTLKPATVAAIEAIGAVPGYGSPVGTSGAFVIVDSALEDIPNMVTGANEEGYHLRNMNFPRDFTADIIADVTNAREGDRCVHCEGELTWHHAVEIGNIFQLGTRYSDPFGCSYLDETGTRKPVYMGSYGIGVGRLLACVAEEHHDENGLMWPVNVAPYDVHIVDLAKDRGHAEDLMARLESEGLIVLLDDRNDRAGVKFNDADLIGTPVRITVGDRSLDKGMYEVTIRRTGEKQEVETGSIVEAIRRIRSELLERS